MRKDVLYDRGDSSSASVHGAGTMERAGSQTGGAEDYLRRQEDGGAEKRSSQHKERRRQLREQQAAEAARLAEAAE